MKNLKLPSTGDSKTNLITAFTLVDGTKKYSYTEDELNSLIELYGIYDTLKGVVDETHPKLTKLSNALKDATKAAYNEVQKSGRLKEFRKNLLASSQKCPICRFEASTTLDHQLPKDTFEAYSIYSSNLAPMCSTCNNKKRTCEVGNTEKSFYHIYYEILPDEQFLKADLSIENGKFLNFTFHIEQSVSMDEMLYKKLSFIFDRLDLDERLNTGVNEYIFDLAVSFKKQDDSTIQQFLEESINDGISRYGYNHWKVAILSSLRDSTLFCNGLYKTYDMK